MNTLLRVFLISTLVCVAIGRCGVPTFGVERVPGKPTPVKTGVQEGSVIIVNERALVGPNSAAQLRGGRLFLPIASIASALGDTLNSDSTLRLVTIRRQNGTVAI